MFFHNLQCFCRLENRTVYVGEIYVHVSIARVYVGKGYCSSAAETARLMYYYIRYKRYNIYIGFVAEKYHCIHWQRIFTLVSTAKIICDECVT